MDRWILTPLGEVLLEPMRNGIHKGKGFQGHGVPIIKMGEVYSSPWIEAGDRDLVSLTPKEIERLGVADGDLLFCRTSMVSGGVGRCAMVRNIATPTTFASNLIRARVDPSMADSGFIHWVFRSPLGNGLCQSIARGTSVTTITGPDLSQLKIPLPSLPEQRAIAEVLGALDDKIESNRRVSHVIDQLIPLLHSRQPESPQAKAVNLGEVAVVRKGVSYRSSELAQSEVAMVSLKCVGRDGAFQEAGLKEYVGSPKSDQYVSQGELLVAQTDLTQNADVVGRVIRVPADLPYEKLVASLDMAIVRPKGGVEAEYLFAVMTQPQFRHHCRVRTSGTTVLHLAAGSIESFEFLLSPPHLQAQLVTELKALLAKRDQALGEARTLRMLRDALLPELLSGRIRVPEAQELVEDAS